LQPIAENAEAFPASDDDGDMEDEPSAQPGVSSSAPALHVDAYNAVQSNLMMAQEYIATALSSLRLTDITTYGVESLQPSVTSILIVQPPPLR